MKLTPRRGIAAAAIAAAAILLPAVALASSAGTGSAKVASRPAATAQPPRCLRSYLTSWVGEPGSQTAGSTYYQLEISNISGTTCTLYGYPGVSALGGGSKQLGSPAGRSPGHKELVVTLSPYQTAHVILQITDVYNFPPSECDPTPAYSLRVFAPGDFSSTRFPLTFTACADRGPVFLHVSTTISGTGIPGYTN